MGFEGQVVRRVNALVLVCVSSLFTACVDTETPAKIEAYAYPVIKTSVSCEPGSRAGAIGVTNGEASTDGIRYNVRTPSNYNAAIAHPLLMVYAPGSQSRWVSERLTELTPMATGAGFIIAYADHRPIGIPNIEKLSTLPGLIAKKWCIDEKRVYLTGHSDGGTVSLALAVLDQTKNLPAGIAPSAAGFTGKDLEAFKCRSPIPVMILHSANDGLFRGWGKQTVAWWAACNKCDTATTKKIDGGCVAYQKCAPSGATLYCEGVGSHPEWPTQNRLMLDFFANSEQFRQHSTAEKVKVKVKVKVKNMSGELNRKQALDN